MSKSKGVKKFGIHGWEGCVRHGEIFALIVFRVIYAVLGDLRYAAYQCSGTFG
ncbi:MULTISPECIES: hypothetical protein [Limnospira]|nr:MULTISPECIES: hypothetical protein [Limnospira]MDT9190240.1 hypothetical protein [Limnospira sp. PMC 894.15]QNH57022.1 MAG: hypothetical protein H2674_23280 [Limnospira indica BM01]